MTMRFVFVRHGHYDHGTNPDQGPLTEHGERQAREAGEYLRQAGIVPDFVVTTRTLRTRQTARLLLAAMGRAEQESQRLKMGGFTIGGQNFDAKVAEWRGLAPTPPETLLFVGHEPSQDACQKRSPGLALPKGTHGVVVVFEREGDGEWRVVRSFGGSAP
jgi:broad specificity phosphatase PhoE